MIREDRVALNDRFVKVFKMLEDRGDIVKNDRHGRGVGDVAHKVLDKRTYGHIIRAYLDPNNKRVIDYSQARAFCRAYNVSESYMIEGIGHPFDANAPSSQAYETYQLGDGSKKGNIIFTTVEAFAGTTVDLNSFSQEQNTLTV